MKESATKLRASAADHFDSMEPIFAERRLRSRSAFQEGSGTEERPTTNRLANRTAQIATSTRLAS